MTKEAKKQAEKYGRMAEILVQIVYHLCGYRLLGKRYRCHYGEIDLIMARGATIVFIEVKFRGLNRQNFNGQNIESAVPNMIQHQRIRRAAEYFLAHHTKTPLECRIDCVVLTGWFRWHFFNSAFF